MLQVIRSSRIPTDLAAFLESKPEAHAFLAARLNALHHRSTNYAVIYRKDGRIEGVSYIGANLLPSFETRDALFATADYLRAHQLNCTSIVGESASVFALWDLIKPVLPRERLIRRCQPLLTIATDPLVPSDPEVRLARADELDLVVEAGIQMFVGEVGEPPNVNDFRAHAIELIVQERTYIRTSGDQILFKADVGAVGAGALQIHGVWVPPEHRGRGIGTHGMASAVRLSKSLAPRACLYVNDFNLAARASYRKVGFTEVGEFSSIFL